MYRLLCSMVLAFVAMPAAVLGQAGQLDTESIVRQALAQADQGTYTSTTQKELGRLGDASGVALTKIIGGKTLGEHDFEPVLLIITLSYSDPRIVDTDADRQPRTTLLLLNYLNLATSDAKLKEKIATAETFVSDQYAKSLKQGRATSMQHP